MKKESNMINVKARDAKQLINTIVEVEASEELYNKAVKNGNYAPAIFKKILEQYMHAIKVHKDIWRSILNKYVAEDDLLYYRDIYKFDIYKKVIFLPDDVTAVE